jgi:hypothetical protein
MSAHLHRVDLGIRDGEAAPAVPEHRVELVQVFRALRELLDGHPHRPRELLELLRLGRQKLVERRIEEADRDGQPAHLSKEADEVFALEREQLRQRGGAAARVVGQDHLAHPLDALLFEEHVLRAAEADPLGPERTRRARVERRVRVGADLHRPRCVGPRHELAELAAQRRAHGGHLAGVDVAAAAVDRDDVALLQRHRLDLVRRVAGVVVDRHRHRLRLVVQP